jgi:hypothetical protein
MSQWLWTAQIFGEHEDELIRLDSGVIAFTNKRYIFLGSSKNIDQPLTSLIAIAPFDDSVSFIRSGKQRTEFLSGNYHWPLIASVIMGLIKNANESS